MRSKTQAQTKRSLSTLIGGNQAVSIRFEGRKAFGEFGALLRDHQIPYDLAGFQTLVLAAGRINALPQHLATVLNQAIQDNEVAVSYTPSSGKRAQLPSPEKAKELLKRFTKEL